MPFNPSRPRAHPAGLPATSGRRMSPSVMMAGSDVEPFTPGAGRGETSTFVMGMGDAEDEDEGGEGEE